MNIKKNYLLGFLCLGTNYTTWSMQQNEKKQDCKNNNCHVSINKMDLINQLNDLMEKLQIREEIEVLNTNTKMNNILNTIKDELILESNKKKLESDELENRKEDISIDYQKIVIAEKNIEQDKKKIQQNEKEAKMREENANQGILQFIEEAKNAYTEQINKNTSCQEDKKSCASNNLSDFSGQESDRSSNYYETQKQKKNINNFLIFDIQKNIAEYKDDINKQFSKIIDDNFNVVLFLHQKLDYSENFMNLFFADFLLKEKNNNTELKIIILPSLNEKKILHIYNMHQINNNWKIFPNHQQKIPEFSKELKKSLEAQGLYAIWNLPLIETTLAEIFQKALTDFSKVEDNSQIYSNLIYYYTDQDAPKIIKTMKEHLKDPRGCLGEPVGEDCLRYQIKQKFSKVQIKNTNNFVLNNLGEKPKLEEIPTVSCFYQESKDIDIALQVIHFP